MAKHVDYLVDKRTTFYFMILPDGSLFATQKYTFFKPTYHFHIPRQKAHRWPAAIERERANDPTPVEKNGTCIN